MFVTCLPLYSTVFECFFDLKIPFNHYKSPISTYSDIPVSPDNEH